MSYIDYLFKGIPIMIVYSNTVICGDLQNNIAVYVPSTSQHKLCLF